ncbi:MAG: DUF4382 domain-containing protein [Bacteroidota bacterium]
MNKKFLFGAIFLALCSTLMNGCSVLFAVMMGLSVTDSPIDDPLYEKVYLTVKGIEINGEKMKEFDEKITLNIAELQNGVTKELAEVPVAEGDLDAVTLILDFDKDENGEAPGCYAETSYGRKIDLSNGRSGDYKLELLKDLQFEEDEEANLVLDIDLRKAMRNGLPGEENDVSLVDDDELRRSIRVIREETAGNVLGTLTNQLTNNPQVGIFNIYSYARGTFDKNQEQFDGNFDGRTFEQAISSTRIQVFPGQSQAFGLYYLEPGEYDLVIEAWQVEEFSQWAVGMLKPVGAELLTIPVTVEEGADTQIQITGDGLVL